MCVERERSESGLMGLDMLGTHLILGAAASCSLCKPFKKDNKCRCLLLEEKE